jgi:hypothetical protein
MISLPALLVGAALLLIASRAQARGAVVARGGGGGFVAVGGSYRAGYGYGYGYPVVVSNTPSATAPSFSSSLPSGYVAVLPAGAAPVVVFGKTYYFANGNYYAPLFYGGTTVYAPANP